MSEYFTSQDTRSIEQMLKEHEELQKQYEEMQRKYAEQLEYEALTEQEKLAYDQYQESQYFLAEARTALDFAKSSTMVVMAENENGTGLQTASLMKDEVEYAQSIVTLTGGFDEKLNAALEGTRTDAFESEFMTKAEYVSSVNAPLSVPTVADAISEEMSEGNMMQTKTVADMVDVIQNTQEYRQQYDIRDEKVIDDTLYAYFEANEAEKLNVLSVDYLNEAEMEYQIEAQEAARLYEEGYREDDTEELKKLGYTAMQVTAIATLLHYYEEQGINEEAVQQAQEELEAQNVPVEIVESNDGYVMNTNQEITQENEAEYGQKVENGNEVVHNEAPRETTIDTAEVGGNVKLEEVHDIGTVEKAEGELTSEQKQDENEKKAKNSYERD